jgi:hypothetical protein
MIIIFIKYFQPQNALKMHIHSTLPKQPDEIISPLLNFTGSKVY